MNNEQREQQMMDAADRYADEVRDESCTGAQIAETINDFCAGWRAADKHPAWIPVEEMLPEDIGGFSDEVYVYCAERRSHRNGTGIYNFISNCWMSEFTDDEITHWMEIVPPQGKEVNHE